MSIGTLWQKVKLPMPEFFTYCRVIGKVQCKSSQKTSKSVGYPPQSNSKALLLKTPLMPYWTWRIWPGAQLEVSVLLTSSMVPGGTTNATTRKK